MEYSAIRRKICAELQGEPYDLETELEAVKSYEQSSEPGRFPQFRMASNRLYYVPDRHKNHIRMMHGGATDDTLFAKFTEPVRMIKGQSTPYMLVIQVTKIHVYKIGEDEQYHLLYALTDIPYLKCCVVAISRDQPVICFPPRGGDGRSIRLWSIESQQDMAVIEAHRSNALQVVAINNDATLVATASILGNVVKVYNQHGDLLNKFRRHQSSSTVRQLVFSDCSSYLACTSWNQPLHVYKLYQTMDSSLKTRLSRTIDQVAANARNIFSANGMSTMPAVSRHAYLPLEGGDFMHVVGFIEMAEELVLMVYHPQGDGSVARIYTLEDGGRCEQMLSFKN